MSKDIKIKKPLIGIIGGKGRMGNWFKVFFEKQGIKVLISDKGTKISNIDLAKKTDITIVSVPIGKTVDVINEIRNYIKKDSLLCDIASIKDKPTKAMRKSKSGSLGMHPLFGPTAQELKGQKIVFCKIHNNRWVKFLKHIFTVNGAEIVNISPEEHDKQMAIVQALVHFANISLAETIYSQKFTIKNIFLTPVFRLQSLIIGRILSQSPRLYAEIEIENPYFKKILDDFKKQSADLSKNIKKKNINGFIRKFKQTSLYLDNFRKTAQTKSTEILRVIEKQPIKTKEMTRNINLEDRKIGIGFLGPKGTFSHRATIKIFPESRLIPFTTIRNIFEAVNNQDIDLGIVPVENTTGGIVFETINNLIEYPLKVSGSFNIRIQHYLMGRVKDKNKLKTIRSHQQALSQCKNWLQTNLPKVKLENADSTIAPILKTKDKTVGFITPSIAASIYNLNILAKNIEDSKENITKFYIISRGINKELQKKLRAKKTIILYAIYDRVGVLRDILNVFAKNKLNLTCLHSIPSHLRPWDYFFFQEVEAPYPSPIIKKTIKKIEEYCPIIRVIGVS